MDGDERPGGRRVAIAVAVVERQGRILIGKRADDAALAGYWEFPGGKVEQGESPRDAARRECREETGVEVRIVDELAVAEHDYSHAAVRIHFFACVPISEQGPLPERFRWAPRGELGEYRFPPANDRVLSLLARATAH